MVGRLIQQQDVGPADHDARQPEELFLPAAKVFDWQGDLMVFKADSHQQSPDLPVKTGTAELVVGFQELFLLIQQAGQTRLMGVISRVGKLGFQIGQFTLKGEDALGTLTDECAGRLPWVEGHFLGHVGNLQVFLPQDKARIRLELTQDQLQQGGFPAAVGDNYTVTARLDLAGGLLEDEIGRVRKGDFIESKREHGGVGSVNQVRGTWY
jgi:hypothetical protein